ncbi:MAG: DinB family protein [Cyclobacteriaceae bacterium]
MQTDNNTLIEDLLATTENATRSARKFKELSEAQLNFKKRPNQWSILECIEHLNRYGDFYLPAIESSILAHKTNSGTYVYKSGLFGNYFANLMKVKQGKIFKMKTPADKNPIGTELTITTIDRFLKQQEMLKSLLNQARHADLTNTKVPISLTKLISLRLGDTFRFFVNHIERHVIQAERVLN